MSLLPIIAINIFVAILTKIFRKAKVVESLISEVSGSPLNAKPIKNIFIFFLFLFLLFNNLKILSNIFGIISFTFLAFNIKLLFKFFSINYCAKYMDPWSNMVHQHLVMDKQYHSYDNLNLP